MRSVKIMTWVGFSREKKLSSYRTNSLFPTVYWEYPQTYPAWTQSFFSMLCFWFGWSMLGAQPRGGDLAFKRADSKRSTSFRRKQGNCLTLSCPRKSSHGKKGFIVETPSRWDSSWELWTPSLYKYLYCYKMLPNLHTYVIYMHIFIYVCAYTFKYHSLLLIMFSISLIKCLWPARISVRRNKRNSVFLNINHWLNISSY